MSAPTSPRGAAPVAWLTELGAVEAAAVLSLRHAMGPEEGRAALRADVEGLLGPASAAGALGALDRIAELLTRHARRPVMRHAPACGCVGGDEACFAQMIAAAGEGRREDALMLACLMLRPDVAPLALESAERLGLALRRMARRAAAPAPRHAAATVH